MTAIDSPDPHFTAKLATIRSLAELDGFRDELRRQRETTVFENHAIAVRYVELRSAGR